METTGSLETKHIIIYYLLVGTDKSFTSHTIMKLFSKNKNNSHDALHNVQTVNWIYFLKT